MQLLLIIVLVKVIYLLLSKHIVTQIYNLDDFQYCFYHQYTNIIRQEFIIMYQNMYMYPIGAGIYSLVRGGSSMLNLHQVHRTGVIRSEHNPSLLMEI